MRGAVHRSLARKDPDLRDLRVLVVGLGRSGRAAARLAATRGARVTAVDRRDPDALAAETDDLAPLGVTVRGGGHPPELAADADLVVLSPGVPASIPLVAACDERGVPVWSEVELAWRCCRGRVVGITGSNGKSTTTAMVGAILRGAGIPGGTGGNLAIPFTELLAVDADDAVHAVELSSFQLETIDAFRADVAAVLNLTPDHLDRYPSYDAYGEAKARLLRAQEPSDAAILNDDDPETVRFEGFVRGREHRFSVVRPVAHGAFVEAGLLTLRTDAGDEPILAVDALPVPGEHNVANALAAALACRLVGVPASAIADGLRGFRALPHRLERIGEIGGVAFYNDSKATNADSTVRAVRSFAAGTVHVILGGRDKGADWAALAAEIRGRVRRALLVGEATAAIRAGLEGTIPCDECGTVPVAAAEGLRRAVPGDVVLLSPGCASFDQYGNFEERGEDFRRAVDALARRAGSGRA